MIVNTTAIVLKTFPYGETSLISRCFTKEKGKISFIIKGAQSKKNLLSPYFQPLSYIQIIYNENAKRELQIISKVNFVNIWTKITGSLKKITLLQSILEITDFTLEKNDPHPKLFNILIEVINYFENNQFKENLIFWFYECELLSELGFRIDLENKYDNLNSKIEGTSLIILKHLLNKTIEQVKFDKVLKKDKKIISNYLYQQLCYNLDGFDRLKSFKVARDILNSV
ncbi:MAG: DNA repair protein RecO [Candidatus Marinimicrobia bacterium]|nr:DNA repair protein RecO [Candidatus Neomarinimicrobiota bacterium]|tara:strand:+ start:38 stop:718 length:681 start_codon:yes stop_codon:yes gene_type:complete